MRKWMCMLRKRGQVLASAAQDHTSRREVKLACILQFKVRLSVEHFLVKAQDLEKPPDRLTIHRPKSKPWERDLPRK